MDEFCTDDVVLAGIYRGYDAENELRLAIANIQLTASRIAADIVDSGLPQSIATGK